MRWSATEQKFKGAAVRPNVQMWAALTYKPKRDLFCGDRRARCLKRRLGEKFDLGHGDELPI